MFFNSLEFAIFLPIVVAISWAIPNDRTQTRNAFLIACSYYFYACWDWRFLGLLIFSSCADYLIGRGLANTTSAATRKKYLLLSLLLNLGVLFAFKYFSFFIDTFSETFLLFSIPVRTPLLSIILPAGISFYTFQTLSYTIDVYRRRIDATLNPLAFFAFVSFFPQLVAGPIERASHLLPQFERPSFIKPDWLRDGLRQILWGLFMKCVIADNCGRYVDIIFADYAALPAGGLWIGAFLFAFQIYGDFSGYSSIAIGSAKLMGFNLCRNFNRPYFAASPIEFWRRWHISLSTWFRDYVYIPLGGSRGSEASTARNLLIVFAVSGLWHGAAWTFVVWGSYHGIAVIVNQWLVRRRPETQPPASIPRRVTGQTITFLLVLIGWIIFRSRSIGDAANYITRLTGEGLLEPTYVFPPRLLLLIGIVIGMEWIQGDRQHVLDMTDRGWPKPVRWMVYQCLILAIFLFGVPDTQFIYFQF